MACTPFGTARAIVWSATHRRRELAVGLSAVEAIVGNKLIPGLLDRYLARHGYDGQQTDEPADPERPDNLFAPVAGLEFGAHGRFDRRARRHCPELWISTHRGSLALVLLLVLAALAWALLAVRGSARL